MTSTHTKATSKMTLRPKPPPTKKRTNTTFNRKKYTEFNDQLKGLLNQHLLDDGGLKKEILSLLCDVVRFDAPDDDYDAPTEKKTCRRKTCYGIVHLITKFSSMSTL